MTYRMWFTLGWAMLILAAPLVGSLIAAGYAFVFFNEELLSADRATVAGLIVLCLVASGSGALSEASMRKDQS